MKKSYLVLLSALSVGLLLLAFQTRQQASQPTKYSPGAYEPVAVVELFTSEGCSSCPAADRLLTELVTSKQQKAIFPLSFHVAYWNHLGWKDPFSRQSFSGRQRRYASVLQTNVYTPQMVFNGSAECVGSNRQKVQALIREALTHTAVTAIALDYMLSEKDKELTVNFSVQGQTEGEVLQLAIVERKLTVAVPRGENGGRKLHHDNVVRQFETAMLKEAKGTYRLPLPGDIKLENAALIAYVQHPETLVISGASRITLHPTN